MESVGRILRAERLRQGKELGAIADVMRITKRYLDAIEKDDLKSLPGSFFYRSFVRQYAELLGMDPRQLDTGVSEMLAGESPLPLPGADPNYGLQAVQAPGRDPRGGDPILMEFNRRMWSDRRMLLPAVALVVALSGGAAIYEWLNRAGQSPKTEARGTQSTAPATTPPAASAAPTQPISVSTGPASSDGQVVLNVAATEKVWLSITSDGKTIFSGTLEPSETKTLSGVQVAKLKVGNAGGIEIRWNGKDIGPVGTRGQVRVVRFTKDNYEILPSGAASGATI